MNFDFSIESSQEKIQNTNTKEYFKEVYQTFVNGNYRSSTVIVKSLKLSTKTVNFIEVTNLPATVMAQTTSISSKEVTIELNLNVLPKLSQELMAVTLYHELLHAYFGVILGKKWSESKEHDEMTDSYYLSLLEGIIIKRFPNTKNFAGGLIYTGLQETELFNKLNENTQNYIKTIIYNFKDGNNGTYCK